MTNFNGQLDSVFPLAGAPYGRTTGFTMPRRNLRGGDFAPVTDPFGASFLAAGAAPPGPGAPTNYNGRIAEDGTVGLDWFGQLHVLPRGVVAFGNIITPAQQDFLIHNAQRVGASLSAVTNPGAPYISLPNLDPLPIFVHAHTSLIDPAASTPLSAVEQVVEADDDGPATFDLTLQFVFAPGGTAILRITGKRITAALAEPEYPAREFLSWRTAILELQDGAEQRIAERKQPRQTFELSYRLDELPRRLLHTVMFDWQRRQFSLPLWHEGMTLSVAASAGGPTVQVESTAGRDIRVGGLGIVYADDRTFDILTVSSVTSTTVTFGSNLANSYPAGSRVFPARLARVLGAVQGRRYPVTLEDFTVRWEVVDNDTGAPTGNTSPFSSFNGRVLLDDPNCLESATMPFTIETRGAEIDGQIGVPYFDPVWTRAKRSHRKRFVFQTRARLLEIRRLLLALRGPQIAFWMPSFIEDLRPTQNLGSASTDLVIENVGYTRFVQSRAPRDHIRVSFNDGTGAIVRSITGAVETSATEETLTVDAVWGISKDVSTIARIEYMELVRISSDTVGIEHAGDGRGSVAFGVRGVFDAP